MLTSVEIEKLLAHLDEMTASELEGQNLEFKQWIERSMAGSIGMVVDAAVCMANGGGGTVVFGVLDNEVGRTRAIIGIPNEVDVNRLKKAVYDRTDPKITPLFDELNVAWGTGRVLIMHIFSGLPPYTDTSGRGTIRVGKDCLPLTGTMRGRIGVETGETDLTSQTIPGNVNELLSPVAMEQLRNLALRERAANELINLSDHDLIDSLTLIRNGRLTLAGVLIAAKPEVIAEFLPGYVWTYLKMEQDTHYAARADGRQPLPISLLRIEELIDRDNPLTTLEDGLFHFEYRTYPVIALREALLNAFCHTDYRLPGPIMVKHHPDHVEISNPGGFIGGVSVSNIIHHPPVARNPLLVEALVRLRLVNRSNLGVSRMYRAFLIEGKDPPMIEDMDDTVRVTFRSQEFSSSFRSFVEKENRTGAKIKLDELIILRHLLRHPEMDTPTAAACCQRPESVVFDLLCAMERRDYVERGGAGRGIYWIMTSQLHKLLGGSGHFENDRWIVWDAAKTRILSLLAERQERGEKGLSNQEIRQITHYDRWQTKRLMEQLMRENPAIKKTGDRRWTRYYLS